MQILSQIFSPYTLPLLHGNCSKTLGFSASLSRLKRKNVWSTGVSLFVDTRENLSLWAENYRRNVVVSAVEEEISGTGSQRKRKVVEHICLVKAKEDLSEEQEKNMLDFLYTTQYQMRGIVALSLGRISDRNPEQCTHAIFMRFQTKEDLAKFYENPFYTKVLKEHVMPHCHVC